MPIMLIIHEPQFTRDHYDSLRPVVQWESQHPDGALLHSCGFDEEGGLHVVDIWETAEHAQSFFTNRLAPALEQLGIPLPQPRFVDVHNVDAYPGIAQHTP